MVRGQKDYMNAKIYKLICDIDDNFYIGSTCTTLVTRLSGHKADSRHQPNRKVYKWMNDVGLDNIRIILINDDFVCDNMDQLRREEDSYIQMYKKDENCMNSMRAYVTQAEAKEQTRVQKKVYREANKEEIKEDRKAYKEAHKEEIKAYYDANKEQILEQKKAYYEVKKEQILERKAEKMICDICQCRFSIGHKSKHIKSKKHINKLKASTI